MGWWRRCWQVGIGLAFGMSGAIAGGSDRAFAQSNIVPDNTLGTENSVVDRTFNSLGIDVIDGGAKRGINLFYSFLEFNVGEGLSAYFFSPSTDIQNILARVTGGNISEILGTLGTFGDSEPNLFVINPNGIIFGAGATLDVGGSFVATTANAIQFGNQGFFSASNPETLPLLTINPSAFLFNQIANGSITNNSQTPLGVAPLGLFNSIGLQVPDERSLLLLGGDVRLKGGGLNAFGGRVELGGVAGLGTVGLNINGNKLRLNFPDNVVRADVSITNGSEIDVTAGAGGSIAIYSRNSDISGGSFIFWCGECGRFEGSRF